MTPAVNIVSVGSGSLGGTEGGRQNTFFWDRTTSRGIECSLHCAHIKVTGHRNRTTVKRYQLRLDLSILL
jgi:hypothetical protein